MGNVSDDYLDDIIYNLDHGHYTAMKYPPN